MRALLVAFVALSLLASAEVRAAGHEPPVHRGHPKVILDRLELSKAPAAAAEEKFLREQLAREARHADWGTGSGSRIEYRFSIDALDVTEKDGVLRVTCAGSGRLPKSPRARARLSFGGAPAERTELVRRVLTIVTRGVISRLADIERRRRSGH